MAKLEIVVEGDDGWSRWIQPIMKGYRFACCDCGLVHEFQFKVLEKTASARDGTWSARVLRGKRYRVEFRARRNNRSTGQIRRSMNAAR